MSLTGRKSVVCAGLFLALVLETAAEAENIDVLEGEKLYVSQCKLCHGNNSAGQTSNGQQRLSSAVHLAIRDSSTTMADSPFDMAFAPPFGPNLRGIYMRPAGTVKGFQYSSAFLKALKGMEWNDAALDVWITNTQAWVPGVYMYYKQSDPGIRSKIIDYLKANP